MHFRLHAKLKHLEGQIKEKKKQMHIGSQIKIVWANVRIAPECVGSAKAVSNANVRRS